MSEAVSTATIYAAARQQVDGLTDQIVELRAERAKYLAEREASAELIVLLDGELATIDQWEASARAAQAIALETLHAAERALAAGEGSEA